MGIYISYYENYVSIVEGNYNEKKNKYNIKSIKNISEDDIKSSINNKYALLEEALKYVSKRANKVILTLNIKEVVTKSSKIPSIENKYLDSFMNNEIYEMMSLEEDRHTFSYEVTNEFKEEDKLYMDVMMCAIPNEELKMITNIFKKSKIKLDRIDTLPSSISRLFNRVEYKDVMAVDVGEYGSIVNIYRNDSLFIQDNIPIRINEYTNDIEINSLIDEIRGLTNFYSSRNYGDNIDTIAIFGKSVNTKMMIEKFEESFIVDIVPAIDYIFDFEEDINTNESKESIEQICSVLGSMIIPKNYMSIDEHINLLSKDLLHKKSKRNKIRNISVGTLIATLVLVSPIFMLEVMKYSANTKLEQKKQALVQILEEYENIKTINEDIKKAESEIAIYENLESNIITWENVLDSIETNIPKYVDILDMNILYNESLLEDDENKQTEEDETSQENEQSQEVDEQTPIYEQIPNMINIKATAQTSEYIGQYVYNLNQISYFKEVKLIDVVESETETEEGLTFNLTLEIEEGAMSSGE